MSLNNATGGGRIGYTGYTCSQCQLWVPAGWRHTCWTPQPTQYTFDFDSLELSYLRSENKRLVEVEGALLKEISRLTDALNKALEYRK